MGDAISMTPNTLIRARVEESTIRLSIAVVVLQIQCIFKFSSVNLDEPTNQVNLVVLENILAQSECSLFCLPLSVFAPLGYCHFSLAIFGA